MRESKGIFNKKYHEIANAVRSFSVIHGASEHIHFSLAEGLKSTADDRELLSDVLEIKMENTRYKQFSWMKI